MKLEHAKVTQGVFGQGLLRCPSDPTTMQVDEYELSLDGQVLYLCRKNLRNRRKLITEVKLSDFNIIPSDYSHIYFCDEEHGWRVLKG